MAGFEVTTNGRFWVTAEGHRSVGSGCLGNGDLCQLCPPHFGQRTRDKRACAHTYFLSLFVWI
jgi:hypothetical protein